MGKKSSRAKYSSKGQRDSVSKETTKAMRRDKSELDKILNKLKVWATGKKVMVTIPNPNKNETNKRFIRVEGTHSAAFGLWKRPDKDMGIRMSTND
jgi:hypothetical protein